MTSSCNRPFEGSTRASFPNMEVAVDANHTGTLLQIKSLVDPSLSRPTTEAYMTPPLSQMIPCS
ncbi:predicted protein [Botrytis cinerea T4]|uniref:Uncharacterized protein n=1 Tax=Botryotinia fuckeliana (strain T4) TaxID=999810 RepID=G2Y5N9_BOTF4|nr:predicted protein [Botrytis cinerea T4]